MNAIAKFENAIENKVKDLKAEGINGTIFWAYRDSRKAGAELLNFYDVIWDNDVEAIVNFCRENGITEFTISSPYTGLIGTLAMFDKLGCHLNGMTTVIADYIDICTGEPLILPAIRMTV